MPYNVYVIQLKKEVLEEKKFQKANPEYIEGKPCYYVGYTSHSPEERAIIHRDALRSKKGHPLYSKLCYKYFDRQPSVFKNSIPFD